MVDENRMEFCFEIYKILQSNKFENSIKVRYKIMVFVSFVHKKIHLQKFHRGKINWTKVKIK